MLRRLQIGLRIGQRNYDDICIYETQQEHSTGFRHEGMSDLIEMKQTYEKQGNISGLTLQRYCFEMTILCESEELGRLQIELVE